MSDLVALRDGMRTFTHDRGWAGYHDPKSLILALMGEVGELAELFQWLPADEASAAASTGDRHERVKDEIADVLLYLVRLADVLNVDLYDASMTKLARATRKYAPGDSPNQYREGRRPTS